jgi:hypothetical protein
LIFPCGRAFGAATKAGEAFFVVEGAAELKSYNPSFQDRIDAAARAKNEALERLRAKPPVDEAVVAARSAAREAREAKERDKKAAKEAAKVDARAKLDAEREAAATPEPTEAERKAARDARYANRKKRK